MTGLTQLAADTEYRTDDYEVEKAIPHSLREGAWKMASLPVYEASESDMPGIEGYRPHTSGDPAFRVMVSCQNDEGDSVTWGLWNPDDDDEYLSHGVTASPHRSWSGSRLSAQIADWLDELLRDSPEALEGFIEGGN